MLRNKNSTNRHDRSYAYPRGNDNRKYNKQFIFNNNVLGGRRCIIEDFLSSGRQPVKNARQQSPSWRVI